MEESKKNDFNYWKHVEQDSSAILVNFKLKDNTIDILPSV
jgi:hypothetical protein